MWRLISICLLGTAVLAQRQAIRQNRDVERAFDRLSDRLERMVADHNRGLNAGPVASLVRDLDGLTESVELNASTRIDRRTRHTHDLDVDNQVAFGFDPHLPRENKVGRRWTFTATTFELLPANMYVFGVKFKSSRTMRVRSVTLHFRDGSKVVHDGWWDVDGGNGQVFGKGKWLPMLDAYSVNQPREAKRLRAIEVVGSAQDRGHTARLEFVFRIPDPGQSPYGGALDLVKTLRAQWLEFEVVDANALNRMVMDLVALGRELGSDYCPSIIAFY